MGIGIFTSVPGIVGAQFAGVVLPDPQIIDWTGLSSLPAGWAFENATSGTFSGGLKPDPDTDLTEVDVSFTVTGDVPYLATDPLSIMIAVESSITTGNDTYAFIRFESPSTDTDIGVSIAQGGDVGATMLNFDTLSYNDITTPAVDAVGTQIIVIAATYDGAGNLHVIQFAADGTITTDTLALTSGDFSDFTFHRILAGCRDFGSGKVKIIGTAVWPTTAESDGDLQTQAEAFGWVPPTSSPLVYVATDATGTGGVFDATCNAKVPTGSDGDLRIIAVWLKNTVDGGGGVATPSGWTLMTSSVSGSFGMFLFGRIKQTGDSNSVTVTLTGGTPGQNIATHIGYAFSGSAPSSFTDDAVGTFSTSATYTPTGITATEDVTTLVFACGFTAGGGWSTGTGGWTEESDSSSAASGVNIPVYLHDAVDPAGAVSAPSLTFAGGAVQTGSIVIGIRLA